MALRDRPVLLRASMAALLVAGLDLSACGRKGALEAPTGSISQEKTAEAPDTGPVKPDKSFFLDPLI